MAIGIARRQFISALGGAAAWPLAVRAQQPTMPVVGFLDPTTPDAGADRLRVFRQGLKDSGNHDDPDRLPRRRSPGQAWSCHQPGPAGRPPRGDQFFRG
jgi:hypothetical protein